MVELTQINVYPVKSCKGLTLSLAELTSYGLKNDRRWMVVDAAGTFLSQRSVPTMALIEPTLSQNVLNLKAPGMESIEVPFEHTKSSPRSVRIWDDSCTAEDCGDDAARWFSQFLGVDCRLVSIGTTYGRYVGAQYSTHQDQVSFADAFPLLLISSASLRDLNSRLDQPVPMNRFRPNLVVSGCEPFAEDQWKRITINGFAFSVSKPCARCTVPGVDQMTGIVAQEPLTTLATYRKGTGNKVLFGQNLINEQKSGKITIGNEVTILETY
ncbi:MAG TPA: MOSC N-terminal beta barrel domain-containing protein [Bacteroidota bacterium]